MSEKITRLITRLITRGPQQAGKWFEQEVRDALMKLMEQENDFWFQRIWDYKTFIKLNQKFFAPRMIADYMAVHRGQFYALEAKTSKSSRYSIKWVKDHQVESALKIQRAGGIYWFLICQRFATIRTKRLYALRPEQWIYLANKAKKAGYKSISWFDMQRICLELHKSGRTWDLSPLFKNMVNRL